MRDYNKLLAAGKKAQLEKLVQNSHKKGFECVPLYYSFGRLSQEFDELEFEMTSPLRLDYGAIRSEAADIANFASMLILKCDQLLEE